MERGNGEEKSYLSFPLCALVTGFGKTTLPVVGLFLVRHFPPDVLFRLGIIGEGENGGHLLKSGSSGAGWRGGGRGHGLLPAQRMRVRRAVWGCGIEGVRAAPGRRFGAKRW